MSVNLVIWVLVSATTAQLIYPWPLWVAGPWGVILLVVSVSVGRWPTRPARLGSLLMPRTGPASGQQFVARLLH